MRWIRSILKFATFFALLISGNISHPSVLSSVLLANSELRKADHAFNEGRLREAFSLYSTLRNEAIKSKDRQFAAEMLNNLAAVNLLKGDLKGHRDLTYQSHREKWRNSSLVRSFNDERSKENLIVNGSFEQGLTPPWGGGQYESGLDSSRQKRGIWWNSGGAKAYMKIDTAERAEGERSLRIRNLSAHASHVFTTTSQRIDRLKANDIYRISFSYKAENFENGAASIAIDAGWNRRINIPRGDTNGWKRISKTINIGQNTYIDFRIILETPSSLWIDDIKVEHVPMAVAQPIQQAEALFDQGQWKKAAAFSQSLIENPKQSRETHWIAKSILARIGREHGDFDTAQAMLEELANDGYRLADVELGNLNAEIGDLQQAIAFYKKALKHFKGDQATIGRILGQLGQVYLRQAQSYKSGASRIAYLRGAQRSLDYSLRIMKNIGDRYEVIKVRRGIATAHLVAGKLDDAMKQLRSALQEIAPFKDPNLESDIQLLMAEVLLVKGNHKTALRRLNASVVTKRRLGDQLGLTKAYELIARATLKSGDLSAAHEAYNKAASILESGVGNLTQLPTEQLKQFVDQFDRVYRGFVSTAFAKSKSGGRQKTLSNQSFARAQWALLTSAELALLQMSARFATQDPTLRRLIRHRQELMARQASAKRALVMAKAAPKERNTVFNFELSQRSVSELNVAVKNVNEKLSKKFPSYASLGIPRPLSTGSTQKLLADDEALILFLVDKEHTYVWLVTKNDVNWFRANIGEEDLSRDVQALRCGLDASNWTDPSKWPEETQNAKRQKREQNARRKACKSLLGVSDFDKINLPFDADRAFKLYKKLLGPVAHLLQKKQLLIVPSGALTQLPFQVLLTEKIKSSKRIVAADQLARANWLIRKFAITTLPSVSSLGALRGNQPAKESKQQKQFLGVGNPLLIGYPADADKAKKAREIKGCAEAKSLTTASLRNVRRSVDWGSTKGQRADIRNLREQPPLPETAHELCEVARDIPTSDKNIILGEKATETTLKQLSAQGKLDNYKIVHFATHGVLAGQIKGTFEPGLILTPPENQNSLKYDDGYLSASEISNLRLNAEWVVLSACNTAGGGAKDNEALSGLARAFFFAGAQTLLVSHWSVESSAAVELVTSIFKANKTMGRAKALRIAMLAVMNRGAKRKAHPAYWAPFVIVGEGSAIK